MHQNSILIGLSKYCRSGPVLDAIKIDKISLVYWKMKFSFIKLKSTKLLHISLTFSCLTIEGVDVPTNHHKTDQGFRRNFKH